MKWHRKDGRQESFMPFEKAAWDQISQGKFLSDSLRRTGVLYLRFEPTIPSVTVDQFG